MKNLAIAIRLEAVYMRICKVLETNLPTKEAFFLDCLNIGLEHHEIACSTVEGLRTLLSELMVIEIEDFNIDKSRLN